MSPSPLRVAIIDDEMHGRERLKTLLAQRENTVVVGEYSGAERALAGLQQQPADVVLLDIYMPHVDGFAFVRALQQTVDVQSLPIIVFVTAYNEFAIRAFDVSATDYLLKPFDKGRFAVAMSRAEARVAERRGVALAPKTEEVAVKEAKRPGVRFFARAGGEVVVINASDVEWVEGAGNYIRLHQARRVHLIRDTLSDVEVQLSPHHFVRVHRSALVNLSRVTGFRIGESGGGICVMSSGARVPVSRSRAAESRAKLRDLVAPE